MAALSTHTSQAFVRPAVGCFHSKISFMADTMKSPPGRTFHGSTSLFSIADEVMDEMKAAMKAKDTTRLATIRLIRASFANAAIESRTDKVSDEQAISALKKMAKMRLDSIDMFEKGGAADRAAVERAELEIISSWLPAMADEETTRKWVQEAMDQVGDASNMGKIMGALMKAHKDELDGSMAQKIVKEEVSKAK
jgi:uncharacterized protein YqeY